MSPETRKRLEIVLVISAILLMSFTFLAPEYEIETRVPSGGGRTVQYSVQDFFLDYSRTRTSMGTDFSSYHQAPEIGHTLALVKMALVSCLILASIFLIVILLENDPLKALVGWMTMVVSVIALAYPVVQIPNSIRSIEGFYGSSMAAGTSVIWAPASGWYLSVLSGALIVLVAVGQMSAYFMKPRVKHDEDWQTPDEDTKEEMLR